MAAGVAGALQGALVDALAADAGVRALFGTPARIVEEASDDPAFPYALIERHEVRMGGSSGAAEAEHTLTLVAISRWGGRRDAVEALGVLRAGVERAVLALAGARVVLVHVVYGDVFRTSDARRFRGLLRVRIIVEGVEP
jgi:hypothetical protein